MQKRLAAKWQLGLVMLGLAITMLATGCDQMSPPGPSATKPSVKTLSYKLLPKEHLQPVLDTPYWNKVKTGRLIISFTPDSPPFCVRQGDQIRGFNHALAEIIGLKLGVQIEIKIFPLREQIPRLLKGETDLILAPLTRTTRRAAQVAFTKPYHYVTQGVLLRRTYRFLNKHIAARKQYIGKQIETFFDLQYLRPDLLEIAVKQGSSNALLCKTVQCDSGKIHTYATNEEAVAALLQQKCSAMVADDTYVKVWAHQHPEHYLAVFPVTGVSTRDGLAIAIRKGDPDFLAWLNLLIDIIRGNGMLQELKDYYIHELSWLDAQRSE